MEKTYQHWQLTIDNENIAHLALNCANSAVNTLSTQAVRELDQLVDDISAHAPKGLVIFSLKDSGFCMGADINEFKSGVDLAELKQHILFGQKTLQKIVDLPFPTIALIHGFCLGGGLELSLACRYRIAEEDSRTQLGLPEVRLGLLPAWGGSVRLPRLINPLTALQMMISGRMQNSKNAKRIGLVDIVVPKRELKNAARYTILNPLKPRKSSLLEYALRFSLLRKLAASIIRRAVTKQAAPAHYPAPYVIIDNWQRLGVHHADVFVTEVESFIRLIQGETAQNLVRLFFLQEQLKNQGKKIAWRAKQVHVIGAGTMGGDIAAWCAIKGLKVSLQDQNAAALSKAWQRAYTTCVAQLKEPRKVVHAMDLLVPDVNGAGIAHADIIIEAVFEDLTVKQKLLKDVAQKMKPDAILATNTSSISLDAIKTALPQPERLVGIHFFNPVAKMQLVEVIHTDGIDKATSDHALAFVHQIGKLPLAVHNCPGFLVNRVIAPYMLEAVYLLEAGVPMWQIDKVATDFGMVMGPIAMSDLVGLDICLEVCKNLTANAPKILQDKVAQGQLGVKSGEGFYAYKKGKMQKPTRTGASNMSSAEILDRLLLPLINECVACYADKIATSTDEIDVGIIFGMGFAPYTGGPMQYAQHIGYAKIYEKLKTYETTLGSRFSPKSGWDTLLKL